MKNKKILYVAGILAFAGTGYVIYRYLKIISSYKKILSINEASKEITNATINVPNIDSSTYQQQDDDNISSGVTLGQNTQDAVMINGIVYYGDVNSGYYISNSNDGGYLYDANTGIMSNDTNSININIPDNSVKYGYFDFDQNVFVPINI